MRSVGCLLGGAIGDALGYAVEFLDDDKIFKKYGENGITDYRLQDGTALISDDTQMTLFTAEGLLSRADGESTVDSIHKAYLNWYVTQTTKIPAVKDGLLGIASLYSTRAPGTTCLTALKSGVCGTIENPINNSKGCGGVMRVAPIAVYCYCRGIPCAEADMLAARAAAITHGHELGYIPAAMLVHIIYRLFEGMELELAVDDAVSSVSEAFRGSEHISRAVSLMKKAKELSRDKDADALDAIRQLGEGWVAEETLAIAVYCCLKNKDNFEQTIIDAVNHSGDSDSTGAVAGNVMGAYLGAKGLPRKFTAPLELADVIVNMSFRLCDRCS